MRTTKEAEINVALLQYIMKCRSAGDDEALAHLGLARQEAETVESLSWGDLEHLSSIHFPVLRENAIDRDLFQRLIHHVQRTRQSQALCDELIARDAPLPMMHRLYGMEASEYAGEAGGSGSAGSSVDPTSRLRPKRRRSAKPSTISENPSATISRRRVIFRSTA